MFIFAVLFAGFILPIDLNAGCLQPSTLHANIQQTNTTQTGTQTTPQPNPFVELIVSSIGLSAIVSGSVAASVNYVLTGREFKKRRNVELLESKLSLYSFMIFHLDRMRVSGISGDSQETRKGREEFAYDPEELAAAITSIDARLETQFYLVSYRITVEWIYLKRLTYSPEALPHLTRLRKLLADEYNDTIVPRYAKMVNERLDRIP